MKILLVNRSNQVHRLKKSATDIASAQSIQPGESGEFDFGDDGKALEAFCRHLEHYGFKRQDDPKPARDPNAPDAPVPANDDGSVTTFVIE